MGASSTKAHSRSKRGALVWDEDDAQQRRHCIHANIPSAARENDKFVMRRTKKYSTNNPTRMAHHVSKRFSNRRADHTISAGDKRMPVDILLIYYGASLSSPLPWNEEKGWFRTQSIELLDPCLRAPYTRRYSVIATGRACHEIPTTSRSRDSLLVTCSTCASSRSAALTIALITVFLSSCPTTLSTS